MSEKPLKNHGCPEKETSPSWRYANLTIASLATFNLQGWIVGKTINFWSSSKTNLVAILLSLIVAPTENGLATWNKYHYDILNTENLLLYIIKVSATGANDIYYHLLWKEAEQRKFGSFSASSPILGKIVLYCNLKEIFYDREM